MSRIDSPIRGFFARARSEGEVDLTSLVAAVPFMLEEAARRRRLAATPAFRIARMGGTFMPRLAAATAALVLLALLLSGRGAGRGSRVDEAAAIDGFIVTGRAQSHVSDPVLDALVRGSW